MRIDIASCSHQGGREYNEDSVRHSKQDGVCVAVVTDGLGGHGGGQVASSIAAGAIARAFMQAPSIDAGYIRGLFEQANAEVVKAQSPAKKMKSTGAALFIKDSAAIWGHVGDTRLYHFKDGRLAAQTLDHSVSQAAVFSGEITKEQIRHHADRNKVLKAFGDDERFKAEIAPVYTLEPGAHAFLLCTDGFWEYVLEPEMALDLAVCDTPEGWIQAMTQRLSGRTPKDNDNYSAAAVLINLESKGGEDE